MNLSEAVLKRRVFKKKVNDNLQATTILRVLEPYINKDRDVIDVGAATGHMTYYFAPRCKHVYAFEAVPEVWRQLKKMEDIFPNVTTYNSAVSNFTGDGKIFVDDKRLSNSGFLDLVGGPPIHINTVCLDHANFDGSIGFIKIDVEGTELDVIEGACRIIDKDRPNLLVEIYEPFSKYALDEIFRYLMEREYRCAYYAHPDLVWMETIEDGVEAVLNKHYLHDGDFLFVA